MRNHGATLLIVLFSMQAHAEGGSKFFPWNWGKNKETQNPPPVEKIKPSYSDMGPSSKRSKISIPIDPQKQQAEVMVQQRAAQNTTKRSLTPQETNLRLPNFFSQNGDPDIPTVKTGDGTYITESFFTGLAAHELVNEVTIHGFKLSDLIGEAPDLSSLQDIAHTGLITYFAEHPGLGGNRDRGYRPQFIPSFVRFVTETYPLMLESGELLYPKDRSLQYIATGEPVDQDKDINVDLRVAFNRAQIAMTDTDGNILGPNMYPIFAEAKVDSENKIFFTSDQWQEMAAYSKGFESFLTQQVLMAFPLPKYPSNVYSGLPYQEAQARRTAREELYNVTPLSDCFKLMAKLKFRTARECFRQRKDELMYRELTGAENYSTLKDFKDAAIRGAIAGGIVTEISGAMDLGTGIGIGALANSMRVAYNRYLRKEDQFTQEQFDALMSMINMYTFAPGPDGIIHPKKGMWKVLENGIIYRYRSEAVITGFRKNEKGQREPVAGVRDFPIDLYGRDQKAEVGFRIKMDKTASPDTGPVRAYGHLEDIRRSENRAARKAAAQLKNIKEVSEEDNVGEKNPQPVQPQKEHSPGIPKVSHSTLKSIGENQAVESEPTPALMTVPSPIEAHNNAMEEENPLLPPPAKQAGDSYKHLPIPPLPKTETQSPPKELNLSGR